jgi:hypothetical protein
MEPIRGRLSAMAMFPRPGWASHIQPVIFRAIATGITDDYAEENGIKIHYRSARRTVIHKRAAHSKGVMDSKRTDVHGRRVEDIEGS